MSDMERNVGVLTPVKTACDEEWAKKVIDQPLYSCYPTYLEMLEDDPTCFGFCNINDIWYEVSMSVSGEVLGEGWARVEENERGVITFDTYHYNGGGDWPEVVAEAERVLT